MIVAVTGGRDLVVTPRLGVSFVVALHMARPTILRHGAARGADAWAAAAAAWLGVTVEAWPANWDVFGRRRAGPLRNRWMLTGKRHNESDRPRADLLIAFPGRRGTADCCAAAVDLWIPLVFVRETTCPICGGAQVQTSSGVFCGNGHCLRLSASARWREPRIPPRILPIGPPLGR